MRASRIAEGKNNELIVHYIGFTKTLRQALADYTRDSEEVPRYSTALDKSELIERVMQLLADIENFFSNRGSELDSLLMVDGFERLDMIGNAVDAVSARDEIKKYFGIMVRELSKLFKFIERGNTLRGV